MHAHAQFCRSGDSTLEAAAAAVKAVAKEEADDYLVLLVSGHNYMGHNYLGHHYIGP